MKKISILLCLFFTACSTPHVTRPGESAQVYVFPYGKYLHDVHLSIVPSGNETPQNYRLNGVVKIDANQIQMVALSSFGTTLFKITDHLDSGKIDDQIYMSQMKAHEDKLLAYYQILKKLLILKKTTEYHPGSVIEIEPGTRFVFGDFDENQIPKDMTIHSPHFEVKIEVTHYDF